MSLTFTLSCLQRTYDDYIRFTKTYLERDARKSQKLSITLYGIIFVLGIIGNGLVIWIAGFRMKKTISAVWFLHLAIADFLCCASLPLRIAQWVDLFSLSDSSMVLCILTIALFSINMTTSILLLTAMSIDRCVSVMWPFWAKVRKTRRLVRITAGGIWVLSLLLTGLFFCLYLFWVRDFNEWCVFYRLSHIYLFKIKQTIHLIRLVIMFVIPFLIILTSYVIVFLQLRKCKRPQRSQRPYRIITAVILCFFICWFPFYLWPLTPMYERDDFPFHTVNTIIIILACVNSCINPIIYVIMGQNFTQGFFRSIPARLERALSEHPEDLCKEKEDHERTHIAHV
ncbi:N-formyl peptide receptor 3-like [Leptodactylus fuscus]|uniref:N-formyl peptide receptor 3-like n=1 Tax=Leptodactylus fuscus TaxID=238119 RepID=UPI003F4ED46A